jgi:hypothetical protein
MNQAEHNSGDADTSTAKQGASKGDTNKAGRNGGGAHPSNAKRDAPEALLILFLLALVFIGFRFRGSLKATDTTTPQPTLGLAVALPGERFPDNAAFLKAGDPIDLLVFPGGATPEWTAEAVVVAVATGTASAVQLDVDATVAATLRALLNEGGVVFQYIPATATPTSTPLPKCGTVTPVPLPTDEGTATPMPTGAGTATPAPTLLPTCEATTAPTAETTPTPPSTPTS